MDIIKVIYRMLLENGWVKHRTNFIVLGILACAIVGFFDYITTDQVDFTFFYLIPVFLTTIATGRMGGLLMSLACAAIKIITDVYSAQPYTQEYYYFLNGAGFFAAFATCSLLLNMLLSAYRKECEVYEIDLLTGVFSASAFYGRMNCEWTRRMAAKLPLTIYLIDIDNLKNFNMNNGYHAGDLLMQLIARVLIKSFADIGIAYRLGGDNFVIVEAEGAPDDSASTMHKTHTMLNTLSDTITASKWNASVSICAIRAAQYSCSLEDALHKGQYLLTTQKQTGDTAVKTMLEC